MSQKFNIYYPKPQEAPRVCAFLYILLFLIVLHIHLQTTHVIPIYWFFILSTNLQNCSHGFVATISLSPLEIHVFSPRKRQFHSKNTPKTHKKSDSLHRFFGSTKGYIGSSLG